ncbi:MAG: substrate-binding domain-containing protein, partial [Candidatus Bathyarchaeota archaeon]
LSGGTSAGVGDLLYRVINDVGKPGILVHGVSVRPGKPLIIAVVGGKPVFGLPGYPTSALMMFSVFVQPVLREMAGLKAEAEKRVIEARAAERIHSTPGRHEYLPVNIVRTELGDYMVYPVPGSSGAITTLSEADGFIEVPGDRAFLEEGEKVLVELFSLELKPADLMIIGSHCVGIDLLLTLMRSRASIKTKVVNIGSSGGLAAIRRGEADIAGTHLLDENTGEYNISFLERFGIVDKAVLVRGYVREQGLIVAKGNPKNIQGLEDLDGGRPLSIINRNPGSGTRILLDTLLRRIAEERKVSFDQLTDNIEGYKAEAKSHTAVAVAVLHGKADLGLAIRSVAERYGLGFLPIADENYDFLIQRSRFEKPSIQTFLEVLRSKEFKKELKQRLPGLSPTEETGRIIYPKDFNRKDFSPF